MNELINPVFRWLTTNWKLHHHQIFEAKSKEIEIANISNAGSNQYEKIKISVGPENMDFEKYGLMLDIKEYYKYLKNYCFALRWPTKYDMKNFKKP